MAAFALQMQRLNGLQNLKYCFLTLDSKSLLIPGVDQWLPKCGPFIITRVTWERVRNVYSKAHLLNWELQVGA